MDRNKVSFGGNIAIPTVALREEGVDRNWTSTASRITARVALREEGVDRNTSKELMVYCHLWSPSARRAWIEISGQRLQQTSWSVALREEGVDRNRLLFRQRLEGGCVALLAEGVDRNRLLFRQRLEGGWSPSSRRAWIEISWTHSRGGCAAGRPPRGGRG